MQAAPVVTFRRACALPLAAALAASPAIAAAEVVTLDELLGSAAKSIDVMAAENEYDVAFHDWQRATYEGGWKLQLTGGYGRQQDILGNNQVHSYPAGRGEVKLAYPLLDAHAKETRQIETAFGKAQQKRIQRDAALKLAELQLEDHYAACWGAQEALKVVEAFLSTEKSAGTLGAEEAQNYVKARGERRDLAQQRTTETARIAEITDRQLVDVTTVPVVLPPIPQVNVKWLEQSHPDLAGLRALEAAAHNLIDHSRWYGMEADFELSGSTINDLRDAHAGNGVFATLSLSLPLTYWKAADHEQHRLNAMLRGLELELRQKSEQVTAHAQQSEMQFRDAAEDVETLARNTAAAGDALLRDAKRGGAVAARRLYDYYALALQEIKTRTEFWHAHVELRGYMPVGSAEPKSLPPDSPTADVGGHLAGPLLQAVGKR